MPRKFLPLLGTPAVHAAPGCKAFGQGVARQASDPANRPLGTTVFSTFNQGGAGEAVAGFQVGFCP